MVRNQDDASFVAWTATLHPESAASTIDPRFQNQDNPWATVYHETCSDITYENIPVAVHVVSIDEDIEANPQQPCERTAPQHNQTSSHAESPHEDLPHPPTSRPQPWKHSNLIDLIIGFSLALFAFVWTIKIELCAIIIYTIAAGFHYLAEEVFSSTPALLGKSICLILVSILMIVDAILLTVSVLVTEILGFVALFVCALFGGPRSGKEWHQFIRRTCHLIRWGFRNCHKGWKLERVFPISMEDEGVLLPLHTASAQNVDATSECPHSGYTDVAPTSPLTSPQSSQWTEEASLPSTVAFPNEHGAESPPIAIAPENVQVVRQEEDYNDEENSHFIKNTQEVVIT